MTTAFVLSGGGSLGAVQVGMLQALEERHTHPDLLVGTSAGAINAAFVAGHGTGARALEELADLWRGLRRRDVFPLDPWRRLFAAKGTRPSLCSSRNLGRLIERHLGYGNVEDADIALHIVATNLLSGDEVLIDSGDVLSAVVASASVPGIFPPVERQGLVLVDGGVADNAAVSRALALGADRIFVLPAGFACALDRPPATALAIVLHALTLLIEQRLIMEVALLKEEVEINVLPPLCPLNISPVDFTRAGEMIERSRQSTGRWLDEGGLDLPAPERYLSLHNHPPL
jgi:NTE family protein